MKKYILILVFNFMAIYAFSQDYSKLSSFEFKNAKDYANAKPQVLECANYLLDNPININESNRLISVQYILKWMEGTSEYTFSIGEKAMELTKGKSELFSLYLTTMTKVVLENPDEKLTDTQIHEKTQEYLIKYCSNPDNKLKPSKAMKKIIKES